MISVIIPTLNCESTLPPVLTALVPAACNGLVRQVVVADGGSADATRTIADAMGCDVIEGPRGRGRQLAAGASAARQPWLLFLHGDTVLEAGWEAEAAGFVQRVENDGNDRLMAAAFRFALNDETTKARVLERIVAWRCAALALPYGDQGLLMARRHYHQLGGFRDLPLMEDVDLVRRVGRRNLTCLRSRAVTSAVRYHRSGFILRSARNALCLLLYFLRVPPRVLVRIYE